MEEKRICPLMSKGSALEVDCRFVSCAWKIAEDDDMYCAIACIGAALGGSYLTLTEAVEAISDTIEDETKKVCDDLYRISQNV